MIGIIYIARKGQWYGFPDFSGGDYISSPRFNVENYGRDSTKFLFWPQCINKNVDSLKELAIDRRNSINTNSIVFVIKIQI